MSSTTPPATHSTTPKPDPDLYLTTILSNPNLPKELKPYYEAFAKFFGQKLYFQLTSTLELFLAHPLSAPFQIELYEQFIVDFESHLNALKLASMGVSVARQFDNGESALTFLSKLLTKLTSPKTREAQILLTMESAHFKLLLGNLDETKKDMDKCEVVMQELDSTDLGVSASFYRVCGDYYKAKAEYASYYKNSLLYLSCINIGKDLNNDQRISRAHDLGLSALLGKIYNFGELLMHPILDSLVGTEFGWIKEMLFAFNAGDIPTFEKLTPSIGQMPILQSNYAFLRQKICLMAMIEAVFQRPTSDRVIPFSVISKETKVPIGDVEHLIMKALSLKLIRGTIDQVASTTSVSWVQPRVLDKEQIRALGERLAVWSDKVDGVSKFAGMQAPEMFAA